MKVMCQNVDGVCTQCNKAMSEGERRGCSEWVKLHNYAPDTTKPEPTPKLLGDKVESGLKSLGITEHTYRDFKVFIGLSDNCNCEGRKESLNKLDARVREGVKHLKEGDLKSLAELAGVSFNAVKRKLFGGPLPPQEDH